MAKAGLGARSYQPANVEGIREAVADPAAVALAREIARRGVTLLSNDGDILPAQANGHADPRCHVE